MDSNCIFKSTNVPYTKLYPPSIGVADPEITKLLAIIILKDPALYHESIYMGTVYLKTIKLLENWAKTNIDIDNIYHYIRMSEFLDKCRQP